MGVMCMYEKIKISISERIAVLLKKDAEDFRVLKPSGEANMNAFINSKACYFAVLMVNVRTNWTNPIRTERHAVRRTLVHFFKSFYTSHIFTTCSGFHPCPLFLL